VPDKDVEWSISPEGKFTISWLTKIADFAENNDVSVTISDGGNSSRTLAGTAGQTTVGGLELGEEYEVFITDEIDGQRVGPIVLEACEIVSLLAARNSRLADPNCSSGFIRDGLYCSVISDSTLPHSRAKPYCSSERTLIVSRGEEEEIVPKKKRLLRAEKRRNLVWVSDDSISQEYAIERKEASTCEAWNAEEQKTALVDCETELPIMCRSTLAVDSPAPDEEEIVVEAHADHVVLRWEDDEGWAATYTVRVMAENANGTMEEVVKVTSSQPFFNVTGLNPESRYTISLETDLGDGKLRKETLLDAVHTTANDSSLPKEIIGYTPVDSGYRTAQLSVFAVDLAMILAAIMIMLASGTITHYADNAMQFCFQLSLLGLLISLLMSVSDGVLIWKEQSKVLCTLAVAFLTFFALCASVFLLLESLVICGALVRWTAKATRPIVEKPLLTALAVFLAVLAFTAVVVPAARSSLIPDAQKV